MDGLPAAQQSDAFDFTVAGDRGLRKRRSLFDQEHRIMVLDHA